MNQQQQSHTRMINLEEILFDDNKNNAINLTTDFRWREYFL